MCSSLFFARVAINIPCALPVMETWQTLHGRVKLFYTQWSIGLDMDWGMSSGLLLNFYETIWVDIRQKQYFLPRLGYKGMLLT